MKTSTILCQEDKSNIEEMPKKARAGKLLKYLLFIFMLVQIFVFYSCAVEMRTPRHVRTGVIIQGTDGGDRHDNGNHNGRYNRNNRNNRNDRN